MNSNVLENKVLGNNLGVSPEEMLVVDSFENVEAQEIIIAATPIDNPDAEYLAATTKIDISGLTNGNPYDAISDGTLTVNFSTSLIKAGPVPLGWATWSSPPFSEDPNPDVLVSDVATLTINLSDRVTIFGFELEPNPFAGVHYTVEYYDGDDLVESITQVVQGNAGPGYLPGKEIQSTGL